MQNIKKNLRRIYTKPVWRNIYYCISKIFKSAVNLCLYNAHQTYYKNTHIHKQHNTNILAFQISAENCFGAKQFSLCKGKTNDVIVGHQNMSNGYFLGCHFNTLINYQTAASTSACHTLGIFDFKNMNQKNIKNITAVDFY